LRKRGESLRSCVQPRFRIPKQVSIRRFGSNSVLRLEPYSPRILKKGGLPPPLR
jgi:hypothetical protein